MTSGVTTLARLEVSEKAANDGFTGSRALLPLVLFLSNHWHKKRQVKAEEGSIFIQKEGEGRQGEPNEALAWPSARLTTLVKPRGSLDHEMQTNSNPFQLRKRKKKETMKKNPKGHGIRRGSRVMQMCQNGWMQCGSVARGRGGGKQRKYLTGPLGCFPVQRLSSGQNGLVNKLVGWHEQQLRLVIIFHVGGEGEFSFCFLRLLPSYT